VYFEIAPAPASIQAQKIMVLGPLSVGVGDVGFMGGSYREVPLLIRVNPGSHVSVFDGIVPILFLTS